MIYLASPYSHESAHIRHRRFIHTREFVYLRLAKGVPLFSPIVYAHQFVTDFKAPTDAQSWLQFNTQMMDHSTEMWVLKLEGWKESLGVAHEIEYAEERGLPIRYEEPLAFAPL